MLRKELQSATAAEVSGASEEVIYKIDIPANRYDMLCLEGIARALNIFLGRDQPPAYRLADMSGACAPGGSSARQKEGAGSAFAVLSAVQGGDARRGSCPLGSSAAGYCMAGLLLG